MKSRRECFQIVGVFFLIKYNIKKCKKGASDKSPLKDLSDFFVKLRKNGEFLNFLLLG
jgi:hypothetical protein